MQIISLCVHTCNIHSLCVRMCTYICTVSAFTALQTVHHCTITNYMHTMLDTETWWHTHMCMHNSRISSICHSFISTTLPPSLPPFSLPPPLYSLSFSLLPFLLSIPPSISAFPSPTPLPPSLLTASLTGKALFFCLEKTSWPLIETSKSPVNLRHNTKP